MLVNASSTNLREAGELITAGLLVRLLIYAGLPALLLFVIRVRPRRAGPELARRLMVAALLWAVAAGVLFANYKEAALWARAHAEVCKYPNPVYPLISAYKLARGSLIAPAAAAELRRVTQRVSLRSDQRRRRVVVLVVGETARADHFSLYGYARDTNPQLAQISSLLRFANVQACGTSTAVSVPCMFSRLDREQFDRDEAQGSENLLDVLMRAGVSVLWRENNTGCQGVCSRVLTEDLSGLDDPRFCTNGTCRDEVLLTGLRERLSAAGDQLIVLHQLGSHGPSYYKRYPRGYTRFQPECALDEAYRCERKALVNTYDNTVLYTDHVLAEVIRTLETLGDAVDAAMLYVSDHGESLGEHGLYLHGFPYALAPVAQTRVPMLAWLSPSLIRQLGVSRECLDAQTQRSLSHDHLFDIVLGLYGIDTDVYRPAADIIVSCRSAQ
jgi:lipid A ethanolaminephosphotransferase